MPLLRPYGVERAKNQAQMSPRQNRCKIYPKAAIDAPCRRRVQDEVQQDEVQQDEVQQDGFRESRSSGAGGRNRTDTLSPEPDFESGASTSSTTPAAMPCLGEREREINMASCTQAQAWL